MVVKHKTSNKILGVKMSEKFEADFFNVQKNIGTKKEMIWILLVGW